jgi:hypothetical protein
MIESKSSEELAMEFAVLVPESQVDPLDSNSMFHVLPGKAEEIRQRLRNRIGYYEAQEAIKRAYNILKMMDFHDEDRTSS